MKEAKIQIEKTLKITNEVIDYHKERLNSYSPKLVASAIFAQIELIKMLSQAEVYLNNPNPQRPGQPQGPGERPLQ